MVNLQKLNTLGLAVQAQAWEQVEQGEELVRMLSELRAQKRPYYLLGGGSNVLFTEDFAGTIVQIGADAFYEVGREGAHCIVRAEAGASLDALCAWSAAQGLTGIEALSGVPGTVGGGVVQNVGAYGQELAEVLHRIAVCSLPEGRVEWMKVPREEFGYRWSPFKGAWKGERYVWAVDLRLTPRECSVDSVQARIHWDTAQHGVNTPQGTREAVLRQRAGKLPEVGKVGSAGSFFKNPTLEDAVIERLQRDYAGVPIFTQPDGSKRVSAGWLIEQCGWKGHREGDAGVYPKQALVLVNYGGATGADILQLSERISASVWERFGVKLQREVIVLNRMGEGLPDRGEPR